MLRCLLLIILFTFFPLSALAQCPDGSNPVGEITKTFEGVEVIQGNEPAKPAVTGGLVCRGDTFRTGPGGRARVEFFDRGYEPNESRSFVNIGSGTKVEMSAFRYEPRERYPKPVRPGIIGALQKVNRFIDGKMQILNGTIRAYIKSWDMRSNFTIRHGGSQARIPGSDAASAFDPAEGTSVAATFDPASGMTEHLVDQGRLVVERPDQKEVLVEAGQMIRSRIGEEPVVSKLDRALWKKREEATDAQDGKTPESEPQAQGGPCPEGDEAIGTLVSVFKNVQITRGNEPYKTVKKGRILCKGDKLRTGPRGRARIKYFDRVEETNSGPTIVNFGSSTEASMEDFKFSLTDQPRSFSAIRLIRGTLRTFMKDWGANGNHGQVRTGTSLCGIRGSHVASTYDPADGMVGHLVEQGSLVCEAPDGQIFIKGDEMIVIRKGEEPVVTKLDRSWWEELEQATDAKDGWRPEDEPSFKGLSHGAEEDWSGGFEDDVTQVDEWVQEIFRLSKVCAYSEALALADKVLEVEPGHAWVNENYPSLKEWAQRGKTFRRSLESAYQSVRQNETDLTVSYLQEAMENASSQCGQDQMVQQALDDAIKQSGGKREEAIARAKLRRRQILDQSHRQRVQTRQKRKSSGGSRALENALGNILRSLNQPSGGSVGGFTTSEELIQRRVGGADAADEAFRKSTGPAFIPKGFTPRPSTPPPAARTIQPPRATGSGSGGPGTGEFDMPIPSITDPCAGPHPDGACLGR